MCKSCWLALACLILVLGACRSPEKEKIAPTPVVIDESLAPELIGLTNPIPTSIETRDYGLGVADAPVTIIMYGDFQCGRCAQYARDLEILRSEFPHDLQIIWRHLPDTQSHDKADLALQASEAAAFQGHFWDMHAILFTMQSEWQNLSPTDFRTQLTEYAELVGLDVTEFNAALEDERFAGLTQQYQEQASSLQIVGIPTLLINGAPLNDRDDLFGLRGAIRLALLQQQGYTNAPAMQLKPDVDYYAVMETERGTITLDLLENDAPTTVNSFVFLANAGWFDNQTFFLVVPDFYAQTGDPSETGRGTAGYTLPNEAQNGLRFDQAGMVALSHPSGALDMGGSQFFITTAILPNHETEWDGQYTIFGRVVEGLEIVQALTPRNPGDPLRFPNPPPGDLISSIRIEER